MNIWLQPEPREIQLCPNPSVAMEQTQQKALNALEPYVLLSKSANSPRAAADLITQATSAPSTYVFAELLQTPNIQSLRTASEEYSPYLTLLEIFAWGTWSDYECKPTLLTPPQLVPQLNLPSKSLLLNAPSPLLTPTAQTPPTLPPHPLHQPYQPHLHPPPIHSRPPHHPRARRPRHNVHLRRHPKRETRHPTPTR